MRKLLLVLSLCAAAVCAVAQGFEINRFDVNINLRKDGSARFEERIAVTFQESKRGIFRDIPIHYYNEKKRITRSIDIWDIDVNDGNGRELETKVSRQGENLNIRIGSEDIFLSPGTSITYVISYTAKGFMNWFGDEEWGETSEFYWNITGDEWQAPIHQASFRVSFPEVPSDKKIRARVFVGPYGSQDYMELNGPQNGYFDEELQTSLSLTTNSVSGTRVAPMDMYSGVTLVLGLPAEVIEKPGTLETIWTFLKPNLGFAIPLVVFPLFWLAWSRIGRDPHGGPMVVRYDPPEGIGPGEAGYLIDESVDSRDISALMVSLAVKGFLEFETQGSGTLLSPRKATIIMTGKQAKTADLSAAEAKMLKLLQATGQTKIDESDMRTDVAPKKGEVSTLIENEVVQRGYYGMKPSSAKGISCTVGCIGIIALIILVTVITPFMNPVPAIIGGVIALIVAAIFSNHMPRRTKQGSIVREQVRGFEEFLSRARKQEFDWMSEKHPDQSLFEQYLPYAVAFGVTAQWAEAFKDMLTENPNWYHSNQPFNAVYFASDIDRTMESIGHAASTPPRSSGGSGGSSGFSSGGGFSGGGFGGGGGGSW